MSDEALVEQVTREQMIDGLRIALDRARSSEAARREMTRMIDLLARRTREADDEALAIARSVDDERGAGEETTLSEVLASMIARERGTRTEGLSRARRALIGTIRSTARDVAVKGGSITVSSQMLHAAALLARNTEEGDEGALAVARGLPEVNQEGLTTWIELMRRTEAMDAALALLTDDGDTPRWVVMDEIADWPEPGPVVRDGRTRGRLT